MSHIYRSLVSNGLRTEKSNSERDAKANQLQTIATVHDSIIFHCQLIVLKQSKYVCLDGRCEQKSLDTELPSAELSSLSVRAGAYHLLVNSEKRHF